MPNVPTRKTALAPNTVTAHPGPLPGTEPGAGAFKSPKFSFSRIFKTIGIIQVVVIIVGLGLAIAGVLDEPNTVNIGDSTFKVKIADSPEERTQGLSNTASLAVGEGMLFIFDEESFWPIWMKEMNYPIDIIWLNKDKQVISVDGNVSPESYPSVYLPKERAFYAVEVRAGAASNIKIGQLASFTKLQP